MTSRKKWARRAAFLFVIGLALALAAFAGAGFSFRNLSGQEMIETVFEPEGEFENISLIAHSSDVKFAPSEDGKTKIVCRTPEKTKYYAKISDNTLLIDSVDTREWFDKLRINWGDMMITVYLPQSAYQNLFVHVTTGNVVIPAGLAFENARIDAATSFVSLHAAVYEKASLKTTTGDIDVKGLNAKELSVRLTTGDANLSDVTAKDVYVKTTTGKIRLTNVKASDKLVGECTTGGIRLNACDAGEIDMKATTGDIIGTLLTEKTFEAKAATGTVRVPYSKQGGLCSLETTTGDIDIAIEG
ncbi:MAG: DUF4097 family beta strand repeat protein [Clostridia bacterium]|nr:DUF4097 family beta strand repeat protein [Clostridia bacterium]